MPVFYDFDFQIALARRRGANFVEINFQKCSEPTVFYRFRLPNRSRAQAWCKFCRDLGHPILRTTSLFGPTFANLRSHETTVKHSISRNSYPPKHLCCENIDAARATGNFQYSRKLELLNFLWLLYSQISSTGAPWWGGILQFIYIYIYNIYIYIYDPVIRDHGPPPQWYGGVRGRLSGPPPHHRGRDLYTAYIAYTIYIIYTTYIINTFYCTIYTIYTTTNHPLHTTGGRGLYTIYIYICCIYSIYHIHNIYIKHHINILYILYIHTYIHHIPYVHSTI